MGTKQKLEEIKTLREIKGKEEETLAAIDKLMQAVPDDLSSMVTLNWEAALVWQHVVMNELVKPEGEADTDKMADAKGRMASFAKDAHKIVVDNNLDLLGLSHRFLGRVDDYSGNYVGALTNYKKALEKLPKDSVSSLEVRAFIAYSTVMKGEAEEGMRLAKEVFADLKDSEFGKKFKEDDYFLWGLWFSGIPPRQLFALQEIGADYGKGEIRKWLEEVKEELEHPTGDITWGDDRFQFRIDEINKALSVL